MGKIYRHYGPFNPDLVNPIRNRQIHSTKPDGGFWVSDINANYGWVDWCKNEMPEWIDCEYHDFKFKEGIREYVIDSVDKLNKFLDEFSRTTPETLHIYPLLASKIDFEKVATVYDALTLVIDEKRELYYGLYGWDCDSTLVLNKNILIEVGGSKNEA